MSHHCSILLYAMFGVAYELYKIVGVIQCTVQSASSNTLAFYSKQPCLITMTKEVIKCWAFYKMIVSWQSLGDYMLLPMVTISNELE